MGNAVRATLINLVKTLSDTVYWVLTIYILVTVGYGVNYYLDLYERGLYNLSALISSVSVILEPLINLFKWVLPSAIEASAPILILALLYLLRGFLVDTLSDLGTRIGRSSSVKTKQARRVVAGDKGIQEKSKRQVINL